MRWISALVVAAVLWLATSDAWGQQRAEQSRAATPTRRTMLRQARSEDGLSFTESGEVFLTHAGAPDVLRLPGGDLLAVFDFADDRGDKRGEVLATSRSRDGGRSWSAARVVQLRDRNGRPMSGRHGDLSMTVDGSVRLYYATARPRRRSRAGRDRSTRNSVITVVRAAATTDTIHYRVDERFRVFVQGREVLHPTVAPVGRDLHLYAGDLLRARRGAEVRAPNRVGQHYVARGGRRFARVRTRQPAEVAFVGSVLPADVGLRAYVSSAGGIRTMVSDDGNTWRLEPGVRVANAWDPGVTRLQDGSYLMIYCAPLPGDAPGETTVGGVTQRREHGSVPSGLVTPPSAAELALLDGDGGLAGGTAGESGSIAHADGADDFTGKSEGTASADGRRSITASTDEDGFAPLPDFRTKVDYFDWFRQHYKSETEDNAYFAYDAIMPGFHDAAGDKPEWPKLINMYSSATYEGPPAPWDPAQHPDWVASSENSEELLAQFREATAHAGYAYPLDTYVATVADDPDAEPLLLAMLLPQLSSHRMLIKATLAEGWRMEDGQASPRRMLDSWRTCLANAGHLNQGTTLIEELVSTAERSLVHKGARWALHHDVFAEDGLEDALDLLMMDDPGNPDPTRVFAGEHAAAMDLIQYMFWPEEPSGEPVYHPDRGRRTFGFTEDTIRQMGTLTAGDAYAAIDTFDRYQRELVDKLSIGYPEVRAGDIRALTDGYDKRHDITGLDLIGHMDRVHTLRTRVEASRRATQLAYAAHIFKAKKGRWPDTLDELGMEFGYEMCTDPFTADYFGYRVTESGPTIYSLSENGVDDGGVHAPRWEDRPTETGSDDHVFWPPQP